MAKARTRYMILGRGHGRDMVCQWFSDRCAAIAKAKEVAALPGQSPVALIDVGLAGAKDAVTFYFANGDVC